MTNELIIRKNSSSLEIALLADKKLSEFHREEFDAPFQVGDFYLGKVRKISPSLNAAFINLQAERDGFLTYFDLGPNVKTVNKFVKTVRQNDRLPSDLDRLQFEDAIQKTGSFRSSVSRCC